MPWLSIILALLKLADYIASSVRENQLLDAGADRAIAQASAGILAKTKVAKEEYQKAMGLTDAEVDEGLREQEPK
jgi:hypothetical protein